MVEHDRVVAALPAYEISSELGRGAHGVVLAGRHRQLGRLVAIKQLPVAFGADDAVRERFIAEARVLATLDHPHIVAIYDFVDEEGLCLLVMERLTGGTVWSRFYAGGFSADVSCAILLALCAGLHHAHQHGVLHRDIKPENLMFSGEGTLKVTDLGIAKVVGGASTLATRAGEVLGTPAYIAPEQARGLELTPATDVYQAGTVLYELLAGRLPFPVDSDAATTLYRHVHEPPPPLLEVAHHIPAQLAAITDQSISTSPQDRYQSAEEFGIAIAQCAAQTWGRGWLSRTNVPVSASGPILSAALGEVPAAAKPVVPPAVETPHRSGSLDPVPGEYLPVQILHPELREENAAAAGAGNGRAAQHRRMRRIIVAAVAAVAVLVAAVAVVAATADNGSRDNAKGGKPAPTVGRVVEASAWRVLPSAPTARQQVASAVSGGVLWVFGGLTKGVATAKVEGFDPAISSWAAGPDLPVRLHHAMAVRYHGELTVMGGWIPRGSTLDAVTSKRVFALRQGEWVELPPLLHARAAGAAAVVGDRIVVAGGQANHQLVPATEVFDGSRWVDVASIPTPRDHLAGATDGKYFYAVGGRDLSADKNLGAVERYDPATNQWDRMPDLPTPRGGLGAVVAGKRLITIGGESPTTVYGTVEVLNLATNTWTALPPMKSPRHGLAVLAAGNTIYTVDGAAAPGHTGSVRTNEAFDLCGRSGCPS